MMASRRVGYAPGLPEEMKVHFAQVLLLAQRGIERRDSELVDALNAINDSDNEFFDVASQHFISFESATPLFFPKCTCTSPAFGMTSVGCKITSSAPPPLLA